MLLCLSPGEHRGRCWGDAARGYRCCCVGFCISSHHPSAHILAGLPKTGWILLPRKAGWVQPPPPHAAPRSVQRSPPITSAADSTQLARRWHFASWANIVSASSKSGSLENKRKIWTKIAVGKSVRYRPSPCPALCVQTGLMPCRKVVPLARRQGKHKQIAQLGQSKVLQWVLKWGLRGLLTSDPPLSAAVIPGELRCRCSRVALRLPTGDAVPQDYQQIKKKSPCFKNH